MSSEGIEQVVEEESWGIFSWEALLCLCFLVGMFRLYRFLKVILSSYFRKRLNLKARYNGGWALVTGGSEGIGESIALQLAKQGFNIILVSRNLQKLQKAKQGIILANHNISVEVYSIDFQKLTTQEHYLQAFNSIMNKDVSILVNNVGYSNPDNFESVPFSKIRTEIKVNLLPIAVLSRLFLTKFRKRAFRAGIINLSSASAMMSFGGSANYSATKTFDDFFSRSLQYEIRYKVDTLTVRPFFVTTPMVKNTTSLTHATSTQTAIEIVNSLGNTDICYGPLSHRLQGALIGLVNKKITSWVSTKEFSDFKKKMSKVQ